MSNLPHAGEYAMEAVRATPPVTVAAVSIAGMALQDWVLVATLIYTVLQIGLLIRKFIKDRANGG